MATRVLNNWVLWGLSVVLVFSLSLTFYTDNKRGVLDLLEFFHQANHRYPQNELLLQSLSPATAETRAELDPQAQVEQGLVEFEYNSGGPSSYAMAQD